MQHRDPEPWDQVFLAQCRVIAGRSKDPSTQHGAVIVDHRHRVVGQGF
jgi:deoxycytidylate deaminase